MQNSCAFQLKHPKSTPSSRTLFESGQMAVTLPTPALSPPFTALGMSLHAKLLQLAGSTFPTGPLLLFQPLRTSSPFPATKCQRDYSGLPPFLSAPQIGTLSIHTGMSNSSSTWKMRLIILSLSSFADQLLRKAPRTSSLSVNKKTRQALINFHQTLMAASTAIISSSWVTVF